jgi:pyruvate dehydrogenase E2 component (dihydrolipoamide acetyltransferase)
MPSLGADMTAGTLTKWRVAVGETVQQGDIIAEVETDKGVIEIEVFETGRVQKLLAQEGQRVPVGTVMAEIGASVDPDTSAAAAPAPVGEEGLVLSHGSSEVPLDGPRASPAIRRKAHELDVSLAGVEGTGQHGRITLDDLQAATREPATRAPQAAPTPRDRIRISPFARRLAAERGIDLSDLRGTGPGGAIQASDLKQAKPRRASKRSSAAARMQRAIAAAMTRANDEIPHYYVEHSIDMGRAHSWLRERNASLGVGERLVSGVLVLRAVARALKKHNTLNATWDGSQAVPSEDVHVGLAVSLRGGGLVAPALRNTDQGTLGELMARMTDLVARARVGTLRSSEMTSATITLTSLGERGVEGVTPIIFPPQIAVVGCGATLERPWVVDGEVVARPIMRVTLGADHRVSNGHQGARFLSTLARLLQNPEEL